MFRVRGCAVTREGRPLAADDIGNTIWNVCATTSLWSDVNKLIALAQEIASRIDVAIFKMSEACMCMMLLL